MRLTNIAKAKVILLKSTDAIDQCIAQALREFDSLVSHISEFSTKLVAKLLEAKQILEKEINTGIIEAESTIFEQSPTLNNKWAKLLRSFDGDTSILKCFSYKIDSMKAIAALESICTFSHPEKTVEKTFLPNQPMVFGILKNVLTTYGIISKEKAEIKLPKSFGNGLGMCQISPKELLVVGAEPSSTRAYRISIGTGDLTSIDKMLFSRRKPGLVCVSDTVYVFGGKCSEAEKYAVSASRWTRIWTVCMDMPCPILSLFEGVIYVLNYALIGVFTIATEGFNRVSVQDTCFNPVLACLDGDEIIVTSLEGSVGRLDAKTCNYTEIQSENHSKLMLSQCPAALFENRIYYVTETSGKVCYFDIDFQTVTHK